jgi:hypothetical protein
MSTASGGASSAKEDIEDVNDSLLGLYEDARLAAERDALRLLTECRGRGTPKGIEDAARALTLSAGRLAGFAANLGGLRPADVGR